MNKVLVTVILSANLLRASTVPSRTTIPTTTPGSTVPSGACLYEGKVYADGETIYEDTQYKCYGAYCEAGNPLNWDHECFFYTPQCSGWTERVLGQCCPVCYGNVTTPQTTIPSTAISQSSVPPGGCIHDGKPYANGEKVASDPNDCSGSTCTYGVMISYETQCHYPPNVCPGVWQTVPGECCKVCITNQTTTKVPQTTTNCTTGGRSFTSGEKTVDSQTYPCKTCECMSNGTWSCVSVQCTNVSDCEVSYRPQGECCYTCSGKTLGISIPLVYILLVVSYFKWTDLT